MLKLKQACDYARASLLTFENSVTTGVNIPGKCLWVRMAHEFYASYKHKH
jgi:hypothetical protein